MISLIPLLECERNTRRAFDSFPIKLKAVNVTFVDELSLDNNENLIGNFEQFVKHFMQLNQKKCT